MNTATIIEVNTVFISYQAYKRAELDYVRPLKNVQTVTVKLKCFLTEVFCLSTVRPQFVPGKMSLTAREGGEYNHYLQGYRVSDPTSYVEQE